MKIKTKNIRIYTSYCFELIQLQLAWVTVDNYNTSIYMGDLTVKQTTDNQSMNSHKINIFVAMDKKVKIVATLYYSTLKKCYKKYSIKLGYYDRPNLSS